MNCDVINFCDIKKGLCCIDKDGDVGIIQKCDDIHNIYVIFNYDKDISKYSSGLYCLDINCEDYEPLYYIKKDIRLKKLKSLL